MILYFVAYFFTFIFNSSDELYEVVAGTSASSFDGAYTALILRSETTVNADTDGYVNFFVADATPVYSGQQIYLLDKSGRLSDVLKEAAEQMAVLNENDLDQIRNFMLDYKISASDSNYYETYHFKYQLESGILELINSNVFNSDLAGTGDYIIYYSEAAGILMHYTDGLEDTDTDSFEASSFRKNNYNKNIIRSNDHITAGSPVYKVITSNNWNLVIQISDPDPFKDIDVLSFEFLKDGITASAEFELVTRGGNYYGIISLNKYMIRYVNDRYLQISVTNDKFSGLMIPRTSVVKKTYYAIPAEYLTRDGESFAVKTTDPNGNETINKRTPDIFYISDELCYIPTDDESISYGDILIMEDSENEFQVGMTSDLPGVYVYNTGKTTFKRIEIIGENNGFYIIDENTPNGVSMYDQIFADQK